MRRRRAAAAADDVDAKVVREMDDLRGESLGRLVVMHLAVDTEGKPGIRQNRNRQRRILAKIANALGHMLRTGAAVHADDVDRKRRERGQRGADLGAVEHRAKHFDRHLRDDRHARASLFEVLKDCRQARLLFAAGPGRSRQSADRRRHRAAREPVRDRHP